MSALPPIADIITVAGMSAKCANRRHYTAYLDRNRLPTVAAYLRNLLVFTAAFMRTYVSRPLDHSYEVAWNTGSSYHRCGPGLQSSFPQRERSIPPDA